jgi:hypothetical protein
MPEKLPPFSFPVLSWEGSPLVLDGLSVVLTHVPDMPTAIIQFVSYCMLVEVRVKVN